MNWPKPFAGQVIRYSYLWNHEALEGREESVKDRPCAIVMAVEDTEARQIVVVLPITHTKPRNPAMAIPLPADTKRRLGLDDEPSWIMIDEHNWFRWPGPDLRPSVNGDLSTILMGVLPPGLFKIVKARFVTLARAGLAARVARTE